MSGSAGKSCEDFGVYSEWIREARENLATENLRPCHTILFVYPEPQNAQDVSQWYGVYNPYPVTTHILFR
jgi:hypothetical protein